MMDECMAKAAGPYSPCVLPKRLQPTHVAAQFVPSMIQQSLMRSAFG